MNVKSQLTLDRVNASQLGGKFTDSDMLASTYNVYGKPHEFKNTVAQIFASKSRFFEASFNFHSIFALLLLYFSIFPFDKFIGYFIALIFIFAKAAFSISTSNLSANLTRKRKTSAISSLTNNICF